MRLSWETLTSIIRTGKPILVELIDVVNFTIIYLKFISNELTQMVNFPTLIPDYDSHSSVLLDLFLSSDTSICSTIASPPWEILIMVLYQLQFIFYQIYIMILLFIV